MKKIITLILLLASANLFAQNIDAELEIIKTKANEQSNEIKTLKTLISNQKNELNNQTKVHSQLQRETNQLKKELDILNIKTNTQNSINDSLTKRIQTNKDNIVTNSNELDTKIKESDESAKSKISALDSSLGKNRMLWIFGSLLTLLLGGLIYWLLGKRIQTSKTDVETQIKNTKTALEEESVKLDNKLVEVLTKQLDVIKTDQSLSTQTGENNHSLVLKVADRLTAMETNHYRMDPNTKGLKQLVRAVKSIKENYLASGYEIVEMIGQEYKEGTNSTVSFITSEDLELGKKIITKIIKPQVNFNGKMIQAAQIEVSVGE